MHLFHLESIFENIFRYSLATPHIVLSAKLIISAVSNFQICLNFTLFQKLTTDGSENLESKISSVGK
jgi:hypothetical protein